MSDSWRTRAKNDIDDVWIPPSWRRASEPIHLDPTTYVPIEPGPLSGGWYDDDLDGDPDEIERKLRSDPANWRFAEELRVCEACSDVFLAQSHNHRFCSPECRDAGTTYERTCITCGKVFRTPRAAQRFCSQRCNGRSRMSSAYEHTCPWCGERFRGSRREQRFCSRACYNADRRARQSENDTSNISREK